MLKLPLRFNDKGIRMMTKRKPQRATLQWKRSSRTFYIKSGPPIPPLYGSLVMLMVIVLRQFCWAVRKS